MYVFGIVAIILTFMITWLRRAALRRNHSPLPDNFVPDFGAGDKEFQKKQEMNRERLANKWEEQKAKETSKPAGFMENLDKEMEYIKAKKELERKHRIRKRATYEGAFALYELGKQQRERKVVLAKLRKEIFEKNENRNGEPKKDPVNIAEKYRQKPEKSDQRKSDLDDKDSPSN